MGIANLQCRNIDRGSLIFEIRSTASRLRLWVPSDRCWTQKHGRIVRVSCAEPLRGGGRECLSVTSLLCGIQTCLQPTASRQHLLGQMAGNTSSIPTWLENCPLSIARGAFIGSLVGGGFHIAGGAIVRRQGRTTLQSKHIAAEATKAAVRVGAVVGLYTTVRCSLLHWTRSDAISCGAAGAIAVALPTATSPERMAFLQQYYASAMSAALKGAPVPRHLILASAGFSGAIIIGGTDMLLSRLFGLRW